MTDHILLGTKCSPKSEFRRNANAIARRANDGDSIVIKGASYNDQVYVIDRLSRTAKIVSVTDDYDRDTDFYYDVT